MRAETTRDVLAQQIRARICGACPNLPAAERKVPTNVMRSCETDCPIFARMRALAAIADHMDLLISAPGRTQRALGDGLPEPEMGVKIGGIVEELGRRRRFRRSGK